jgi:hypothetical protein
MGCRCPSDVVTVPLIEKIFAAAMVVVCVLLLLRMLLGARRRTRVDASLRRNGEAWQRRVRRLVAWPAAELRARRETKEAIRRARRSASERDGNVIARRRSRAGVATCTEGGVRRGHERDPVALRCCSRAAASRAACG